jgi:hypothetical protein
MEVGYRDPAIWTAANSEGILRIEDIARLLVNLFVNQEELSKSLLKARLSAAFAIPDIFAWWAAYLDAIGMRTKE